MAKTDDYAKRAAEFLKVWQSQMTQQMNNPDTIAAMLAAMQSFGAKPHDETARQHGHAPDARDDAIRQLAKRLDAVERELAALRASILSVVTKAKNPARAGARRHAKPVSAVKRPVGKGKQRVVSKPKPAVAQKRTKK